MIGNWRNQKKKKKVADESVERRFISREAHRAG